MRLQSVFIGFMLCIFCAVASSQEISVMTYNVRFDNPGDSLDRWDLRKEGVVNFLRQTRPTVFGTQEGKHHQVKYMDEGLSDYAYVGVGRDFGDESGEYCALFYDTTMAEVDQSGTFWLSESGDTSSVGWDAAYTRICTYARFRHVDGQSFYVFNAHFDHVGKVARERSARQIIDSVNVQVSKGFRVVLLGDFNSEPEAPAFKVMERSIGSAWGIDPDWPIGPRGTFTGFDTSKEPVRQIDHIFVSGFEVLHYEHLDPRSTAGRGLSDHLPVVARLEFE